jgi:hypothetical protein
MDSGRLQAHGRNCGHTCRTILGVMLPEAWSAGAAIFNGQPGGCAHRRAQGVMVRAGMAHGDRRRRVHALSKQHPGSVQHRRREPVTMARPGIAASNSAVRRPSAASEGETVMVIVPFMAACKQRGRGSSIESRCRGPEKSPLARGDAPGGFSPVVMTG